MALALIDYEAVARGIPAPILIFGTVPGLLFFQPSMRMPWASPAGGQRIGWAGCVPRNHLLGGTVIFVGRRQDGGAHMKKLALFAALLMATSPVAAQSAQQALGAAGTTNNSLLPNTGIICEEEMTATFCNVSTGPNNAGYGTNAGAAATSAGITTPSPAIPTCSNFPPADELCN